MPPEQSKVTGLRRDLGERLATFRKAAGITQGALARATNRDRTAISHLENGRVGADERFWAQADELCKAGGALIGAFRHCEATKHAQEQQRRQVELAKYQAKVNAYTSDQWTNTPAEADSETDETAALELLRRVTASDVGDETLTQLEHVVDDLAVAYSQAEAWCYETGAWRALTEGEYARALELSEQAKTLAPAGSSIVIQATGQVGRAHAHLGQATETYAAIDQVHQLVSPLTMPDRPEHHYRYDPTKAVAYTATTLAWLGDPAAESWARDLIVQLQPKHGETSVRPRRVAAANLDLALTLLVTGRLDEACAAARIAIVSGRVVPSNYWRVEETVSAVEARGLPEAVELREAYRDLAG